jgi:hypothetical protein
MHDAQIEVRKCSDSWSHGPNGSVWSGVLMSATNEYAVIINEYALQLLGTLQTDGWDAVEIFGILTEALTLADYEARTQMLAEADKAFSATGA